MIIGIYPASGDPFAQEQLRKSFNRIGIDWSHVRKCYTFDEIRSKSVGILISLGEKANTELLDLVRPGLYSYVGGMETLAGQLFSHANLPCWIYPNYNPRVVTVSDSMATEFCRAMDNLSKVFSHNLNPVKIVFDINEIPLPKLENDLLAVDTEGFIDKPWCATVYPHTIPFSKDPAEIKRILQGRKLLFHSALHDVRVLRSYDLDVTASEDTILQLYHLGEVLGLKEATFRFTGLVLTPYTEIIKQASTDRLRAYLLEAISHPWEPPIGRARPVSTRLGTILNALETGGPVEVYKAWKDRNRAEIVAKVEEKFGPLPETTLEHVDLEVAKAYAINDPICTAAIHTVLRPRIHDLRLDSVYNTDIQIIPMLNRIQVVGLPIDPQRVTELTALVREKLEGVTLEIAEKLGADFNPASSKDVAEAIGEEGITLTKKTKGGSLSTGKQVLKALANESQVAGLTYRWRELSKLETTYVPAITKFTYPDNRIRPRLRTTNVNTGRLSCGDPNLLAFPARSDIGTMFRKCFVAPRGWRFVNIDLAQIEMRIMAHMSQDPTMIQVINDGLDMHTATAALMYKIPMEQVTKAQRTPAKSISFLVIYEGGPYKLMESMAAEGIEEPVEHWKETIKLWNSVYPRVQDFQEQMHREALNNGYVRDFFGRIGYFNGAACIDRAMAARVMRQSSNYPIQSGAQVLIKRAMIRVWNRIQAPKYRGKVEPMLQVHDELIFICIEDLIPEFLEMLKREVLADSNLFSVKLDCSTGVGESWGDLK